MMQLIIVFSVLKIAYGSLTLAACSTYTTTKACRQSGYCEMPSTGTTCQYITNDCYRFNEVQACKSGGSASIPSVTLISTCSAVTLDYKYYNVCGKTSETSVPYGLLRFRRQDNITNTADTTLSSVPVTVLTTTTTPQKYTYQLFTLDILMAEQAQLTTILTAFQHGINQLITDTIQPKFLEKAVIETFQNIRDDLTYTLTTRTTQLTQAWSLVNILFQRYWVYKSYYTVNYDFINFGFSDLNRLAITMTGPNHQIDITWNSYSKNGYIYVMTFGPEQFGITSTDQKSDLIWVKVVDDTGTELTTSDIALQIKYTWTSTTTYSSINYSIFTNTFTTNLASLPTPSSTTTGAFVITTTTYVGPQTYSATSSQFLIFHHGALKSCSTLTSTTGQPYYRLGMCP